jgi:hypothetical protein
MAKIPKAVQAQADEAERKLKERMEEEGITPPEPTDPPTEPIEPKPEPEDPQKMETVEDKNLNKSIDDLEEKKAEEEIHKLKSEEGRYKKRISDLEALIEEKDTELSNAVARIEALETANTPPAPIVDPDLFTEEEREFLGDDYIEMSEKIVQSAISRKMSEIDERLQGFEEKTQLDTNRVFLERLTNKLGISRERFDKIDNSAKFAEFLEEDVLGVKRLNILDQHLRNLDLEHTAEIYQDFIKTLGNQDQGFKRAPMPEMGASNHGIPSDGRPPYTYTEVAKMYTSGQISKAQKDAYERQLDEQFNVNM